MVDVPVAGTLFCSDGTEIALHLADMLEGTEEALTTSIQSNFTISAAPVGTAYAGKTIVASTPIQAKNGISYAYLIRAGTIINIFPVAVFGVVSESKVNLCTSITLMAGDSVQVLASAAASRVNCFACYTNRGQYHVFKVTSSGSAQEAVSVLTGKGIGDTFQGQTVTKAYATANADGVLLAPSGGGVYVLDDKNNVIGAVAASAPGTVQCFFDDVNIPIGLNYEAQFITSA